MKRSEALHNIANVLRLTGNHYCDDGRDEQDAERILKRIEAIGMLPPAVEDSIKIEEGENGELFIPIWKWENE